MRSILCATLFVIASTHGGRSFRSNISISAPIGSIRSHRPTTAINSTEESNAKAEVIDTNATTLPTEAVNSTMAASRASANAAVTASRASANATHPRRRTSSTCRGKQCRALKRSRTQRDDGLLRRVIGAVRETREVSNAVLRRARHACATTKGLAIEGFEDGRSRAREVAVSARDAWSRALVRMRRRLQDPRVQHRLEQARRAAEKGVSAGRASGRAAGRLLRTAAQSAGSVVYRAAVAASEAIEKSAARKAHYKPGDSGGSGSGRGGGSSSYSSRSSHSQSSSRSQGSSSSSSSSRSSRSSRGSRPSRRGAEDAEAVAPAAAPAGSTEQLQQRSEIRRLMSLREGAHYEALGVDERASDKKIKSTFRKLARLLHPDKCKEPNAHAAFLRIQAAHGVLTDNSKRLAYDRERALSNPRGWFGADQHSAGAGYGSRSSYGQPAHPYGYQYPANPYAGWHATQSRGYRSF